MNRNGKNETRKIEIRRTYHKSSTTHCFIWTNKLATVSITVQGFGTFVASVFEVAWSKRDRGSKLRFGLRLSVNHRKRSSLYRDATFISTGCSRNNLSPENVEGTKTHLDYIIAFANLNALLNESIFFTFKLKISSPGLTFLKFISFH